MRRIHLKYLKRINQTYKKWLNELERYEIDGETSLVGHSCGGGFLVRWLSESDIKVDKVIMIAPWINTDHVRKTDMFNFDIDPKLADRANKVVVFYSDNDAPTIKKTVKKLMETVDGIEFREFKGYDTLLQETCSPPNSPSS